MEIRTFRINSSSASQKCHQHRSKLPIEFSQIVYFQIPFVVISPGPEPMTRHAKLTTIESACENRFYTQDLKNVDRKGIAIVLGHNASNHFCPTVIISQICFMAT